MMVRFFISAAFRHFHHTILTAFYAFRLLNSAQKTWWDKTILPTFLLQRGILVSINRKEIPKAIRKLFYPEQLSIVEFQEAVQCPQDLMKHFTTSAKYRDSNPKAFLYLSLHVPDLSCNCFLLLQAQSIR